MNEKLLKWTPAKPIIKQDNIISSKSRASGYYGFKPSYESEPLEKMWFIMSNEYMRLWFQEREKHENEFYIKRQKFRENKMKRTAQRMMAYRKQTKDDSKLKDKVKLPAKKQLQNKNKTEKCKSEKCPKQESKKPKQTMKKEPIKENDKNSKEMCHCCCTCAKSD